MDVLLLSAAMAGSIHALAPDHWLPFVMLGRSQNWTARRLTTITLLAGVGHLLSSFAIGAVGIYLGVSVSRMMLWEWGRGDITSWAMIGFGLLLLLRGLKKAGAPGPDVKKRGDAARYWTLFALIVFGPCEPLIPFVTASYAYGWPAVLAVFSIFSLATLGMMLVQAHLVSRGLCNLQMRWMNARSEAMAGGAIALSGLIARLAGI